MAVHNGARFLDRALESVLQQTLQEFEFIVVDDGSTDETLAILARCTDRRLRVVSQDRTGQNAALNRGLELATGEFIARQDADDVWLPGRLEWQVRYLESHPLVGAVGAQAVSVDETERPLSVTRLPTTPAALRWHLLFESPFVHSAVLARRDVLDAVGGYRTDDAVAQLADYELWSRIARTADLANAPIALVLYREHPETMSKRESEAIVSRAPRVRKANLEAAIGSGVLADRMVRHARALRLEHVRRLDADVLQEAIETLVGVQIAFFTKYARALAVDLVGAAEIRAWMAERLLVAARQVVRRPTPRLARVTAAALLGQVGHLLRSRPGRAQLARLGTEVVRRMAWSSTQYHARSAQHALRCALRHPLNRALGGVAAEE
jgi:glycosyltransferase involved in cell wall biosynthesis